MESGNFHLKLLIMVVILSLFPLAAGSSGSGSSPRGHSNRDSDTDDSLSGDYPRGWGILKRQQSSPRDPSGTFDRTFDCHTSDLMRRLIDRNSNF